MDDDVRDSKPGFPWQWCVDLSRKAILRQWYIVDMSEDEEECDLNEVCLFLNFWGT
jgi:hypothetical protein